VLLENNPSIEETKSEESEEWFRCNRF
jgi:hypothetical protein